MDYGELPGRAARRDRRVIRTGSQCRIIEAYADLVVAQHWDEFVAAVEADADEELLAMSNAVSTKPLTNELMIQHKDHLALVLDIWVDSPGPISWGNTGKPADDLYFLVRLGWAEHYGDSSARNIVPSKRGMEIVDGLRAAIDTSLTG